MNNRRQQLFLASSREFCKCTIQGKTIKYNQLITPDTLSGSSFYDLTYSASASTGYITISGTANYTSGDPNIYDIFNSPITLKANHKYIIHSSSNNFFGWLIDYDAGEIIGLDGNNAIATISNQGNYYVIVRPSNLDDFNGNNYDEKFFIVLIDLTELNLDNITSASEFFETDLGKYIKKGNYLAYNTGNYFSATFPIYYCGINIWDEQWQNGYYYSGSKTLVEDSEWICSKNSIRVKPSKKYYIKCDTYTAIYFFNGDTYIDAIAIYNGDFNTPNDCDNILFMTILGTYNHNICISEVSTEFDRTQGTLGNFDNTTPRNFEENKYYAGLTINNYYYQSYISNLSVYNGTIRFQTSGGGYGVAIPYKAKPNKTYYLNYVSSPTESSISVSFYDKNGAFISYSSTTTHLISTPANTYWLVLVLRPQVNVLTTYKDIVVVENKYYKYCGGTIFPQSRIALSLTKGSTYKSWGLDEISYNELLEKQSFNNVSTSGLLNNFNLTENHKYIFIQNYSRQSAGYDDTDYQVYFQCNNIDEYNINLRGNFIYIASETTSCDLRIQIYSQFGRAIDFNITLIDLTLLGLDNITSVADFNRTPLGILITKGYYLPYTTTNKTTKEQLVATMETIILDSLSWTFNIGTPLNPRTYWYAKLDNLNIKNYANNEMPNAICNNYKVVSVSQDIASGYQEKNLTFNDLDNTIQINSGDPLNSPTGVLLAESKNKTMINTYTYLVGTIQYTANVVSKMISRRIINVESANNIDLDFTKE